jgi:hypothetical protein
VGPLLTSAELTYLVVSDFIMPRGTLWCCHVSPLCFSFFDNHLTIPENDLILEKS